MGPHQEFAIFARVPGAKCRSLLLPCPPVSPLSCNRTLTLWWGWGGWARPSGPRDSPSESDYIRRLEERTKGNEERRQASVEGAADRGSAGARSSHAGVRRKPAGRHAAPREPASQPKASLTFRCLGVSRGAARPRIIIWCLSLWMLYGRTDGGVYVGGAATG